MSGQSLLYIKMKTMPGGNRYLYITVYYHYPNCAKALQDETELALGQVKDAFAHLRNFRAACPRKLSSILDDDGNLISDKMAKAHRWKNYFEQLLNHPPVPCPDFLCNAQEDHRECLEPSESEVHSAVRKLKNGKPLACVE